MLLDEGTRKWGYFLGGSSCNTIRGAMLFNGRFALLMDRKWGDLRKLSDIRMMHNNMPEDRFMHYPPFTMREALSCMLEIARGMAGLHSKNIIHGDLKAVNVLVSRPGSPWENPPLLEPLFAEFKCYVADCECSVGVLGTGFWRAPEILLALKNQNQNELFTKASDVYSYGMTRYEILTGCVPFELEGFKDNEYDRVIDGCRPRLPRKYLDDSWVGILVE